VKTIWRPENWDSTQDMIWFTAWLDVEFPHFGSKIKKANVYFPLEISDFEFLHSLGQ